MRKKQTVKRNKIYGITFGIAFVCVMLFAACDNALSPLDENGYGQISIDFEGGEARTVLPSTAFDKYVYTFTKSGGAAVEKAPDKNGIFTLEIGSYTVEVKAYVGTAGSYTLVASGVSSQFTVSSGSNAAVKVLLSEVNTGGQGKFTYTITYPVGATADISLKKWPDLNDIALSPSTQGNSKTQTVQLASGSYLLKVLVDKNGLYGGISEALHIYPALTTVYTKTFQDNDLLQGTGAAVSAPTGASSVTTRSITVNAVAAPGNGQTVEYAISAVANAPVTGWQDSTTFSNLAPGTTYYIFARSKENSNYIAGAASAYLSVTSLIGYTVTANGSPIQTTTQLTFIFDKSISGLSASDITLGDISGVIKGTFGGSGVEFTLPIGGFTEGGILSVAVSKSGCDGSQKAAKIYYYDSSSILTFTDLSVFKAWLDAQPDNTIEDPYVVALKFNSLDGLNQVLQGARLKYVCLDFSGSTFTSIGEGAFLRCYSLTSVTIPDSVTSIGEGAFIFCTSLSNITIPSSVTSIGAGAFEHCSGLTSLTIPDKRKMTHFTQLQG